MIFRFENPIAFMLFLVPLGVFLIGLLFPSVRSSTPLIRYSDTRVIENMPISWRIRLRRLPDLLRFFAWVLLVFVIARPQSGRQQEVMRGEGIDIVLALDISSSMEVDDIGPSRLEAAKNQIQRFIQDRTFDRVGLVVFSSDAYHYVPPTLDYNVLISRLETVKLATEYDFESGTAIGTGIVSAANMLRNSEARSQVIILLTDGANNRGSVNPLDAARAAATLGIRIYTIGMGRSNSATQGAEFDEVTLLAIAEIADGLYFRAEDVEGLRRTYEQINTLERSEVEQQVFVRWQERAMPPMIIALLLLLVERIARLTIFRTMP